MKHSEFVIGQHVSVSGASLWRVTDVGTRTIVAIRIDHGQIRHNERQPNDTFRSWTETVDYRHHKNTSWLSGPPYAVAEIVFDEYDLPTIEPVADADVMLWQPDPDCDRGEMERD